MEYFDIGARIAGYRKARKITQEMLALQMGVSNQAVSKWENGSSCPDIFLLPQLADFFEISLDELFGREFHAQSEPVREEPVPAPSDPDLPIAVYHDLPWDDDNSLHAVVYVGHRMMRHISAGVRKKSDILFPFIDRYKGTPPIQLTFTGSVDNIFSDLSVNCTNSEITGSVKAGNAVTCGNVGGDIRAGDSVECGDVVGNVRAGDGVRCGSIQGDAHAGDSIHCGDIQGNAVCGDSITCSAIHGSVKNMGGIRFTDGTKSGKHVHIHIDDEDEEDDD